MALTNQEISDKIKALSDKIESLKKERTTLEVKLEQIAEKKEELRKEIVAAFGTDDLNVLEAKKDEFIKKLESIEL
nr:MAG TPA: cell division protein [Caudoviricetes sp.]